MGKRVRVRALRMVFAAAAILAGATGVAFATGTLASIVGADGTITGCYLKDTGQLRVVRNSSECRSNELPVTWSQQGPEGEQGPKGDTGLAGADGTSVTTSVLQVGDENCPSGGVALESAVGTSYVCNGADGRDGEDGEDGADGEDGEDGQQGPPGPAGGGGCDLEHRILAALPSFELSPACVPPPAEGDVCDDGDGSTYDDKIRNGVCAGLPTPDCDDGDADTLDYFDPIAGSCVHEQIDTGSPEVCDGIDNDLDGAVDNVPPHGVPHGTMACVGGSEQLFCDSGFANGDGQPANGCEVNLMTDPANCGALGNVVSIPHATGACVGGQAVLVSCEPGWHNANGSPVDGCELHEDQFEPNDTMAAARTVNWGMLTGNIAPAGDDDWYRYSADCQIWAPCSISFVVNGPVSIYVYEDGVLSHVGGSINLGLRVSPHEYLVRVTAPGFVNPYTLTAAR